MKSGRLEPNQHLDREQILQTFGVLNYPLENIVSTIDNEGFAGAEISSPEDLNQAIQDVLSKEGDKNNRLILFSVGAENKSFVPNEGENNHYVALHFVHDGTILDKGKVRVGTISQDSEFDEALDNLLLAFTLPKSFQEFKDLDEARRVKLYKTGIDGRFASNYKPDICQKNMLGMMAAILKDQNYEYYNFPSIIHNKLLQRGIPKGDANEIGDKMLDFVCDKNRAMRASVRVEHLAKQQGLEIEEIKENPHKGANMSFTAMVNGKKHYIKTCCDASNGKVDQNELFVYKVMEYVGFGPRTNFLFGRFSSAAGRSSISRGNYIMTEDLDQNGNRLLLDTEENRGAFQEALAVDRQFAEEISAASALSDILSLTDTFGRNVRNYGLLIRSDGGRTIQFVDHLPNANNGLFSLMDFNPTTYSPRAYLQSKSSLGLKADEHSAFKDLEGNRFSFKRMIIQRDVNNRLSNLEEAIKQAELDVRSLMRPETYGENFIEEAGVRMTLYMEKIGRYKATYERSIPQATQEAR